MHTYPVRMRLSDGTYEIRQVTVPDDTEAEPTSAAFRAFDIHTEICSACAHGDYCRDGATLRRAWLLAEERQGQVSNGS